MYTLYKDKPKEFKCIVEVEGSSISNTSVRLVLSNKNKGLNLLYTGTINENGECVIPIHKLGNILDENEKGTMILEVIVDDTIFTPYTSEYTVKQSKKVKIHEVNNEPTQVSSKPTVNVSIVKEKVDNTKLHVKNIKHIIENVKKGDTIDVDRVIEKYNKKLKEKVDPVKIKKML